MELSLAVILGKVCYFQDYLALHIMKAFLDHPEDFLAHRCEQFGHSQALGLVK